MWKDQKGMTLVEIIITIAIAGILMGTSVTLFGHVRYANTQRVVETVDAALNELRVATMSQQGRRYLYIYQLSDGCYMKLLDEDMAPDGNLDADGTKLCDGSVKIRMSGGRLVEGSSFLCVAYTKSGGFLTERDVDDMKVTITNTDYIEISGSGTYTIHLVSETGKHYITNQAYETESM